MESVFLKRFKKIEYKRVVTRERIFLAAKIIFLMFLIFIAWYRNK